MFEALCHFLGVCPCHLAHLDLKELIVFLPFASYFLKVGAAHLKGGTK